MSAKETLIFNLTVTELKQLINEGVEKALERIKLQSSKPSSPQKEIILIDEVCELTCLAKPTVYGLVNNRKLPYFKRGKKLMFRRSEIITWIETGRQRTNEEIAQDSSDNLSKANKY